MIWAASGAIELDGVVDLQEAAPCASCGMLAQRAAPLGDAILKTYGDAAANLRHHSGHLCPACLWMTRDKPKSKHRAWIVHSGRVAWPMVKPTPGRPLWVDELGILTSTRPAVYAALVTTDPKKRLWPRVRVGDVLVNSPTLGVFARVPRLADRAAEYLETRDAVRACLRDGATKTAIAAISRGQYRSVPAHVPGVVGMASPDMLALCLVTETNP